MRPVDKGRNKKLAGERSKMNSHHIAVFQTGKQFTISGVYSIRSSPYRLPGIVTHIRAFITEIQHANHSWIPLQGRGSDDIWISSDKTRPGRYGFIISGCDSVSLDAAVLHTHLTHNKKQYHRQIYWRT